MVIVKSRCAGPGLELVETKYSIRLWSVRLIHSQTAVCVCDRENVNTVLRVRPGHGLYVLPQLKTIA